MDSLIVSGGEIDKQIIENYIKEHTNLNIIAVDKGLEALFELNIVPNHVVGDFDSVNTNILQTFKNNSNVIFHKYNPEKDNTDTDIALNLAIELNSSNITIIGALGKRIDHALANIHILKISLDKGIPCQIFDKYNRIYLINNTISLYKGKIYGKYISLIHPQNVIQPQFLLTPPDQRRIGIEKKRDREQPRRRRAGREHDRQYLPARQALYHLRQ